MNDAQYMRIETLAGGLGCGNRAFIKAAHTLLSPLGRSRYRREVRHSWLREGLAKLNDMGALCEELGLL